MPSIRLPLATSFLNRSFTVNKDSKIVNGYIEKYTEDHTAVVKRPGLSLYKTGNGCGQGFFTSNNGTLYNISGNQVSNTTITTPPGSYWTRPSTNAFTAGDSLARWRAPAVGFNNKLWYLGGGKSDFSQTNDIYSSADAGITWTKVTTIGTLWTGREDHTACVHNNKIFVIGGFNNTRGNNDVWSSVDGINWVNVAPNDNNYFSGNTQPTVSSSITQATSISFNGRLYILGGSVSTTVSPYSKLVNDVWYSLDNGVTWTKETTINPFTARSNHASCVYNGYLWVAGGTTASTQLNDVWKSSDGVTWTQVTASAAWSARTGFSLQSFAGSLFVTGGDTNPSANSDVWKSSDGVTWTQVTTSTNVPSQTSYNFIEYAGFCILNNSLYHIAGANSGVISGTQTFVWRTDASNVTTTNPADTTYCTPLSFNQANSAASNQYIMYKSSTTGYLINISTGLTTQIIDSNYPATTVPGIVFLDGYFFVMTPTGEIHNSALEDPTTWGSLDFINAEMEPDSGVALAKHLNYLVAFGTYTTEFFFDAANATGSPLQRVDNAFMFYGCATGYSIVHMNNTLVWMSQTQQQGRQIAVMNGFAPQIISTPFIERILAADDLATVYAFNTKVNGHDFYVLTLKTSNITLAFDFTTKQWFQWTSMRVQASKSVTSLTLGTDGATVTAVVASHGYTDGDRITIAGANQTAYNGDFNISYVDVNTFTYQVTGTPVSPATGTITAIGYTEGYFRGIAGSISNGVNLVQDETTGDLYKIDMSNYDDTTGYINFLIRTTNFDAGSMGTKYPSSLEMIGDKETNSHLLVRYSNDDYVTYSKYRKLDLSKKRSRLNRLGSFKRRTFDLRHTDTTPLRLEQVELQIDKEET